MLAIPPHRLQTLEGIAMGPPPKILFGFELDELDHIHARSQVSLAGPRTITTAVTILDVICFLR
jgi:hypothetical protein